MSLKKYDDFFAKIMVRLAFYRVYMAIVVEGKRMEKDSYNNTFFNEITASLKPKKIFSALRPGTK